MNSLNFLSKIVVLTIVLFVISCGSTQGVIEYQKYTLAFNMQIEAGNNVLDSVARAERIVGLRRIKRGGDFPDFSPNDAAYFVDTVQPPVTASIRASLNILKSYNDALAGLANGEAAEALAARLGKLVADLSGTTVAIANALGGPSAVTGVDTLAGELINKINIFTKIFKAVAVRQGREQFREQLIEAAPDMEKFLVELRESTPVMFELLKLGKTKAGSFEGTLGVSSADLKEL
ncbi:MAG: hypothetical protein GY927_04800, partial [bacterium]|nr:hypothetical protein [bacterium]